MKNTIKRLGTCLIALLLLLLPVLSVDAAPAVYIIKYNKSIKPKRPRF
ncbi:MAG: hypothetical protein IJF42_05950 [Clostridia bacterium]|nr:hypothetical protein [Clostridia bacterium]